MDYCGRSWTVIRNTEAGDRKDDRPCSGQDRRVICVPGTMTVKGERPESRSRPIRAQVSPARCIVPGQGGVAGNVLEPTRASHESCLGSLRQAGSVGWRGESMEGARHGVGTHSEWT
jgi:hypothetical protein